MIRLLNEAITKELLGFLTRCRVGAICWRHTGWNATFRWFFRQLPCGFAFRFKKATAMSRCRLLTLARVRIRTITSFHDDYDKLKSSPDDDGRRGGRGDSALEQISRDSARQLVRELVARRRPSRQVPRCIVLGTRCCLNKCPTVVYAFCDASEIKLWLSGITDTTNNS